MSWRGWTCRGEEKIFLKKLSYIAKVDNSKLYISKYIWYIYLYIYEIIARIQVATHNLNLVIENIIFYKKTNKSFPFLKMYNLNVHLLNCLTFKWHIALASEFLYFQVEYRFDYLAFCFKLAFFLGHFLRTSWRFPYNV